MELNMLMKQFNKNIEGKDYAVGDIHGCFTELQNELDKIGFNPSVDRLFSVGDLVDRGPESEHSIDWLDQLWFHAVRGNHEQMAIDYFKPGTGWSMDQYTYAYNGGEWFINMSVEKQAVYANAFNELPFLMEVETDMGRVGILHAEAIDDDWNKTKSYLHSQPTIAHNVIMWARDKIKYNNLDKVIGIDHVVVGHTPLKKQEILGNVHYIDTGAVFGVKNGENRFTIIDLNTLQKVN